MPPSAASGSGASRVHSTTPSGVGSPDATPSANGSPANGGVAGALEVHVPANAAPTASEPPVRKRVRRLTRRSQLPLMLIPAPLPVWPVAAKDQRDWECRVLLVGETRRRGQATDTTASSSRDTDAPKLHLGAPAGRERSGRWGRARGAWRTKGTHMRVTDRAPPRHPTITDSAIKSRSTTPPAIVETTLIERNALATISHPAGPSACSAGSAPGRDRRRIAFAMS
jgi:hypothetical protein